MGPAGLDWQTVLFPLAAGLSQRSDVRSKQGPNLDICRDVQFDEIGGLQLRHPYADVGANIFGGGTITNPRRVAVNGDELLLFTDTALYSWNAQSSVWMLRGTHLACKVDETPTFVTTDDQQDCDRAELLGSVAVVWSNGTDVLGAVFDKVTGATIVAPQRISSGTRPRVIACQTKIVLLWHAGTDSAPGSLNAFPIDPTSPSFTGSSTTVLASPNFGSFFDACPLAGTDSVAIVARRVTTTSYSVFKLTAAMALTAVTKARSCEGPIAVASAPDGAHVQVARARDNAGAAGAIQGDYLTSALADVTVNQALGVTSNANQALQVTAAYRSIANSGHFRCYVFWGDPTLIPLTHVNFVDDAGTIGTAAVLVTTVGLGSRAFDYAGSIYLWTVFDQANFTTSSGFSSQLQNSYFLYRDDGFLVAKACGDTAGGAWSQGHLPGVASTASKVFSWCGQRRRVINMGGSGKNFAQRAPQDVTFTFDSNEARRCVRLGNTLYITGGELLQYDGVKLAEVGFHIFPWSFLSAPLGAGGALSAGTYAYKASLRWENAAGELERSTTATVGQNITVANDKVRFAGGVALVGVTHKTATVPFTAPAIEIWRTAVNPTDEAPFYLVTSKDPSISANPNRYLDNTTANTFDDAMSDATATALETNPENGSVLEAIAPPAATVIAASEDRIFLAGIAGDPDRVWYSRQRGDGEIASFNDALTFVVPSEGGAITAIDFAADGTVIVWRETATYAFPGSGFDNASGGANFGPARYLSLDVGCLSQEAVAFSGELGNIFKSRRGWFLLTPSLQLQYIGAGVYSFDSETVLGVHVMTNQHHVRVLTASRVLVWDHLVNQWAEWTIAGGLDATLWNNTYTYLGATSPRTEQAGYSGVDYGLDVETVWIKPEELLVGSARVRWFMPLGEYRSAHALRVRTGFDYTYDGAGNVVYTDDATWQPSPTVVGSALQLRRGLSRQQCQAVKVRLTAVGAAVRASIDLGPHTGGEVTTVLEAKTAGASANSITVELVANLTGANVSLTEVGNVVTIHYSPAPPGTATVAQIEDLITASSTLLRVKTSGNRASTVAADAPFGAVALTGGADSSSPTSEALKVTGIGFECGLKRGLYRRLPAAQKAA